MTPFNVSEVSLVLSDTLSMYRLSSRTASFPVSSRNGQARRAAAETDVIERQAVVHRRILESCLQIDVVDAPRQRHA